jgi:hypothetical protein
MHHVRVFSFRSLPISVIVTSESPLPITQNIAMYPATTAIFMLIMIQ